MYLPIRDYYCKDTPRTEGYAGRCAQSYCQDRIHNLMLSNVTLPRPLGQHPTKLTYLMEIAVTKFFFPSSVLAPSLNPIVLTHLDTIRLSL